MEVKLRRRSRGRIGACLVPTLVLIAGLTAPATGQVEDYRISQRGTISQKLGQTTVSLDYSRPLARGRTDLFGKVVHWGELWTPGANEATVLEVDREVKLNGHVVPPGRWSMWVIPSRVGPWELVLDARDSLFHTERPELTDDQIRFVVSTREDAAHVEALTWSMPRIAQDGATLLLNWATLEIPLELEVESIEPPSTIGADEAAAYVGEWRIEFAPHDERPAPPPAVLTVVYGDDRRLVATFPPGVFSPPADTAAREVVDESALTPQERERAEARRILAEYEGGEFSYVLVPRAKGVFVMGWVDEHDGALLDAGYVFHEFEHEHGRAVTLVMRDDKDRIIGRGKRDE